MILSMTGFGRAVVSSAKRKYTIEIKSLNGKTLDLMMRLPPYLREAEISIRNLVAEKLCRGKMELAIIVEQLNDFTTSKLRTEVLEEYKEQIRNAATAMQVPEPQDWFSILMRMPDVMAIETTEISEDELQTLMSGVAQAVAAVEEFREKEGQKLYVFFEDKVTNISQLLEMVTPYEEQRVEKIRNRLVEQLDALKSAGMDYDRERLEQELIYYIEKLDVTEEKTRLRGHLSYFAETMDFDGSQGKKLGFIAQEMGREINTLGSKANNIEMQKIVVRMKDELEQIKEQVLNVL